MNVPKPNARQNIFGQLVDWQRVDAAEATPHALQVLPLPKENVPPGFTGAVGSYAMTITASPTNIAVGDPITVKVQISGRGALESISLPQQTGWDQFKVYPPTSDFQAGMPTTRWEFPGTRTFALTVVPQTMDVKELPAYVFSYFDPDQKSYRTATQPAIPLIVRPSAASLPPPTAANPNNAPENTTPDQDVSLIKSRLGTLAQIQLPLVEQPWFLALQGVPVIAWLALLVKRKQAERLASNPRLRREREVEQMRTRNWACRSCGSPRRRIRPNGFLRRLCGCCRSDWASGWICRHSRLRRRCWMSGCVRCRCRRTSSLGALRELFQLCNQARYGRQSTNEELVSLIPKVEAAMNDLKKIKA